MPMQKSWMYWSQSRVRMSKSNSCLSSSDMRERSLSWLVWDHCGQKSRRGERGGEREGREGGERESREGGERESREGGERESREGGEREGRKGERGRVGRGREGG